MAITATALFGAACSSDDDSSSTEASDESPVIVVTTNIWADVVENIACDDRFEIVTIMPPGADPHTFEPSLQDRSRMDDASLVVANGLGLESSLVDTLEEVANAGTPVFFFGDHFDPLIIGDRAPEDSHEDEHGHGHTRGIDPHIWFDPLRIALALPELAHAISDIEGVSHSEIDACLSDYLDDLNEAHLEIVDIVSVVPEESRTLVTNHENLTYFADRYGFEVVGSVIPATTTAAESSIAHLELLADAIERTGVHAFFADSTHDSSTVETFASQLGDITVAILPTESLGEAGSPTDTYFGLLKSVAEIVAEALQPRS